MDFSLFVILGYYDRRSFEDKEAEDSEEVCAMLSSMFASQTFVISNKSNASRSHSLSVDKENLSL